jgi:hypothetical protein
MYSLFLRIQKRPIVHQKFSFVQNNSCLLILLSRLVATPSSISAFGFVWGAFDNLFHPLPHPLTANNKRYSAQEMYNTSAQDTITPTK